MSADRPEPGAAGPPGNAAPPDPDDASAAASGPAPSGRFAVFGGVYSNHLALAAAIDDARDRGATDLYCLGDLGAFGPNPDRVFPLLVEHGVKTMRGNYDDSIARGLDDCQCGYTDPEDNYYARLSYRYTYRKTSARWRAWLGDLPDRFAFEAGGARFLLCHGSPRRMNEFLWESTTSDAFLEHLADEHQAEVILGTHTGLHWQRRLPSGRIFANVGVLGRPANDGRTEVWYALVDPPVGGRGASSSPAPDGADHGSADLAPPPAGGLRIEFVPLAYDHERLAREMREESLPEPFVETILRGWWTTCLEVLPAKERARGRF